MAFTVTARHSGNSATTAAQTLTTSSTTPTADSLLLLFWGQQRNFHSTAVSLQTPTGGSLTYTSIAASAEFSWSSLTEHSISGQMYRADVGGSPSAHTITVDSWSGTTTGYYAAVACDITGHGSSTPVQSKAGGASFTPETDAASGTLTLDSTPTVGNLVVVAIDASADTAGGFTAPTIGGQSMTSLFNQNSNATQACMFYRVITGAESTNVITCTDMGNTVGNWAGVAVEIESGTPPPAFPTIPTTGNGRLLSQNQNNTTATRTFPSLSSLTKNSGDLLIAVVVAYERSAASATFSGWTGSFTELADIDGGATTMAVGIATKTSTGSETGTFAVTQAATVTGHCSLFLMSIEGWHGTTAPELTALAVDTASAADPAALTPSWGAADTLWIAVGGNGETNTGGSWLGMGANTPPTNYTNENSPGLGTDAVGGIESTVAFRQNNTASENVGTWSTHDLTNARNCALLIAIRPTVSGDIVAEPAVIARSFTTPAAGAGVGAAPAVIARSFTVPLAGIGTLGAPAVIARSFTTPQAGAGVGAAPAATATVITLPQATPDVGTPAVAEPAVIARSFTTPQAGAGVGAAPAVVARAFTTPQAGGAVGAAPTVIARSFTAPQAAAAVGVAPTAIARSFTLPQVTAGEPSVPAVLYGAQLGVPTAQPGDFQLGTTPAVSGNATATPAVIARSFALPQVTVSVGAAPAVIARTFTTPQAVAAVGVDVVQTVIARSFTTPQALVSVGAAPAVIARVFVAPQAAVGVGASPAVLAALVAMPAATAATGAVAAPAVIPLAFTLPQAITDVGGGGATAAPTVIARAFTLPQPAVSVDATPAVIARAFALPQTSVGVGTGPALIALAVSLPQAAVSVAAAPAVIARAFTIPTPTVGTVTNVEPAVIARGFTLPQPNVSVAVLATVIARSFTLPQAAGTVSITALPAAIARAFALPQATTVTGAVASPATIVVLVTLPAPFLPGQLRVLIAVDTFTTAGVFDGSSSSGVVEAGTTLVGQPA